MYYDNYITRVHNLIQIKYKIISRFVSKMTLCSDGRYKLQMSKHGMLMEELKCENNEDLCNLRST